MNNSVANSAKTVALESCGP